MILSHTSLIVWTPTEVYTRAAVNVSARVPVIEFAVIVQVTDFIFPYILIIVARNQDCNDLKAMRPPLYTDFLTGKILTGWAPSLGQVREPEAVVTDMIDALYRRSWPLVD